MQSSNLGVGVVYSSILFEVLASKPDWIDFVEIEPETFWIQRSLGAADFRMLPSDLERLTQLPCAKLLHSIGFPVGGSRAPDLAHIALLNRMADTLGSPWVSEHLSFNTAAIDGECVRTGLLLPALQTEEGAECAIRSTKAYAAALNRPLAIETGVNYLEPRDFEMSDGRFIRRVVEGADCGILLDLHNLWTNERNGRQLALDVIAELPLERVWEIHVAGGEERSGYWLDSHCGVMPEPVRRLAREVIPCLPNLRAITLEVFPAYLPGLLPDQLRCELDELREIRASGPRAFEHSAVGTSTMSSTNAPSVSDWERGLAEGILRRPPTTEIGHQLAADPAMPLYSDLLEEFRASMVGTSLSLSTRLLLIHLGKEGMRALLAEFWRGNPPELSAATEALRFGSFLRADLPRVPLLEEILSFEMAAIRAVVEGCPQRVPISCDIRLAIRELVAGRRPEHPGPTSFEFVLEPPDDGERYVARAANLT